MKAVERRGRTAMIVTERIFMFIFVSGAVAFGALIAWMLWAPDIRRNASTVSRKHGGGAGGGSGSRRGII